MQVEGKQSPQPRKAAVYMKARIESIILENEVQQKRETETMTGNGIEKGTEIMSETEGKRENTRKRKSEMVTDGRRGLMRSREITLERGMATVTEVETGIGTETETITTVTETGTRTGGEAEAAAMTGSTGTIMTDMLKTEVTETLLISLKEKSIASRRRRKQMAVEITTTEVGLAPATEIEGIGIKH